MARQLIDMDDDALTACADLVGRTGAQHFQIGYLHDDVPADQAGWYAYAQYRGARVTSSDHPGPVEAANGLARRLLNGAKCTGCDRLVALSDFGAMAYNAHLADGSFWTMQQAAAAGQCRWRRIGPRWTRGCEL